MRRINGFVKIGAEKAGQSPAEALRAARRIEQAM
jgi:hypothetical protein